MKESSYQRLKRNYNYEKKKCHELNEFVKWSFLVFDCIKQHEAGCPNKGMKILGLSSIRVEGELVYPPNIKMNHVKSYIEDLKKTKERFIGTAIHGWDRITKELIERASVLIRSVLIRKEEKVLEGKE